MGGKQISAGPSAYFSNPQAEREFKLRKALPREATIRTGEFFDAMKGCWMVELSIWTSSGEVIRFEEKREEFPSEHMMAQALLVA